jgi:hypothetical protein
MHPLIFLKLFLHDFKALGPDVLRVFVAAWGCFLGYLTVDWLFVDHLTSAIRLATAVIALIGAVASTVWVFRRMRRLDRSKGSS